MKKRLVMIVEDNDEISQLLTGLLEESNYEVITAVNGLDALKQLNKLEVKPDVLLLDIMMPIMDGYEFRNHQLSDDSIANIPVIVMSATCQLTSVARIIKTEYALSKPFKSIDDFINAVDHVIVDSEAKWSYNN